MGRRALLFAGGGCLASRARAQLRFPERPITLVVPFGPSGIADLTARAVAESMARTLGVPVVVDNKPSAGSIVASQAVATARPDGHTLLLMSNGHALAALRGGEIDLAFEIVGPMLPQVAAGTVKMLAGTGERRSAELPDVPTVHEAGVPGYAVASWNALAAPAATPPAATTALLLAEVRRWAEVIRAARIEPE